MNFNKYLALRVFLCKWFREQIDCDYAHDISLMPIIRLLEIGLGLIKVETIWFSYSLPFHQCIIFRKLMKGEIWCLFTVTSGQKVTKLNSKAGLLLAPLASWKASIRTNFQLYSYKRSRQKAGNSNLVFSRNPRD